MRYKYKGSYRYNMSGVIVPTHDADGWVCRDPLDGSIRVTFRKREARSWVSSGLHVRAFNFHAKTRETFK